MAKKKSTRSRTKKRAERRRTNGQRARLFWGFSILVAIVGVLFFAFSSSSSGSTTNLSEAEVADLPVGPQIGARAPDFSLNTARGSKAALSDFRGKPIAIMFFHSWWPVCNQNAPEFRAAEETYGEDLAILFVDEEEPLQPVLDFASRYNLSSPFLMDNDGSIGGMYQLYSTPTTYFIDPNGVVQDIQIGVVDFGWLARNFERSTQWEWSEPMQLRLSAILPIALLAILASACGSAGADGLVTPASDKLTFLYFYIDGWAPWAQMQPIVDGLENEYNTEIEFRNIDANSATGNPIYKSFPLRGHPSYILLNPAGEVVWTGLGLQSQDQLKTQFQMALAPP